MMRKSAQKKVKTVTRRNPFFLLTVHTCAIVLWACGNGGQAPEIQQPDNTTHISSPDNRHKNRTVRRSEAAKQPLPTKNNTAVFDFADRLEAAHLRSSGLLIDFGTEARNKYTLGDWKSGWRGNYKSNDVTFSYVGANAAHLFFDALPGEEGGGQLTVRGRAQGSDYARVYLNGKQIGQITFPQDTFSHATVDFTKGIVPGENELLLRTFKRKKADDGLPAALAIDYLRILPSNGIRRSAAASFDAVHFPNAAGGPDGLLLSAGESIAFNVPVKEKMSLAGQIRTRAVKSQGQLRIDIITGKNKSVTLADIELSEKQIPLEYPLDAHANESVTIVLSAIKGDLVCQRCGLYLSDTAVPMASGKARARNLIWVLIDTLRADRLSSLNPRTRVQTPYLDRLATESMIFERAWTPENWTKPAVASLLSGLLPSTHQTKNDRSKVPNTVRLASEHFRLLGFATAGFVANGYVSGKFGFEKGWDVWKNYVREGKPNRAQYVMDDSIAWLESRPVEKPFYLYIHTIDPHVPYIPPKSYWSRYDSGSYNGPVSPTQTAKLLGRVKTGAVKLNERDKIRLEALYDGEITYHDDQLVRLHQAMERLGLLEDTLLVVTSDHGEEFFDHDSVGHGHSLFEELLHVPLLVRLPGAKAGKGARSAVEVGLEDILPTSCEILGVESPEEIEGRSLMPLLTGEQKDFYPSVSFAEFLANQRAARMGRFKIIYKGLSGQLFDLATDVKETTDISLQHPVAKSAMRDQLGLHLGRFIGLQTKRVHRAKPTTRHKKEDVTIDLETKRQLQQLGYMDD